MRKKSRNTTFTMQWKLPLTNMQHYPQKNNSLFTSLKIHHKISGVDATPAAFHHVQYLLSIAHIHGYM